MVSGNLPFVATYQEAALDALGDPTRRAILERLAKGPCAVGELARDLPVSRPAVSQHLKVLEQAGLVTHHAAGTRRIYRVNPAGFDGLRAYFEQFWTTALRDFKRAVERPSDHGGNEGSGKQ
jgi:DNA-binding transcriptional ArsR family regulator